MPEILLSPRLLCVAGKVRKGKKMADIGTDHAYLPAYLVKNEHITYAIAADLRPGPLQKAQDTITAGRLDHRIETRLSDGLSGILPDESDDIVIAGMGGELIVKIMQQCSWVKNKDKHFVFQPMTHSEVLREYLCENGFTILSEDVVAENKKLYIIMDSVFTGIYKKYPRYYRYTGEIKDFSSEPCRNYLKQQISYLNKKLLGGPDKAISEILKELTFIYDNS